MLDSDIMAEPLQYDQSKLDAYGSVTFTVNGENIQLWFKFCYVGYSGQNKVI